jgi:hypothetical protein
MHLRIQFEKAVETLKRYRRGFLFWESICGCVI